MSPRARLAVTAVLFSTGGAAIKWCGFAAWQLAALRAGIAGTTLLILLPASRHGWTWRTALVGIAYAATTLLYVQANKLTTAADTIFLQNTSPLFLLVLAPWLLHEHPSRRDLMQVAVMAAGMALVFLGGQRTLVTAPNPPLGNALAATCALAWALTVVGYRWLARTAPAADPSAPIARAAVCGNLIACAVSLTVAFPLVAGRPGDWLAVLYLGTCQLGVAYFFFTRAVPQVSALQVSLLLLLEPVLNPIWSWIVNGERPGVWTLAGGAVILSATAWKSVADGRRLAVS